LIRQYYSIRTGKEFDSIELDFVELTKLILSLYQRFRGDGYFAKAFGQHCVDESEPTIGTMGSDIGLFFLQRLRKRELWPIEEKIDEYSEHDLFSVIELLYDYISKPEYKRYHSWNNCGDHYGEFNADAGRSEFRSAINEALRDYTKKCELSSNGEILEIPDSGLEDLLREPLPALEPENVDKKVEAAIVKFHRYDASPEDRKEAVRILADVLEYLRPDARKLLSSADESDLFNIANNYAIRHHNTSQKSKYDKDTWLPWIFYLYLATIHLLVKILARGK